MSDNRNGRSRLWLDEPDAIQQLRDRAGNDVVLQRVGRELIEQGFTILPGIQDSKLIEAASADYDQWLAANSDVAARNRDDSGRQFRLANFHLASEASMKLAKSPEVMRVLDFVFGRTAAVHTSLTFQYSTMQELHRDSPYFHTFPEGQFVGVWTALQDVDPNAGPLSYVPGSHRFTIDQHKYYLEALETFGDENAARGYALARYQAEVTARGKEMGERAFALLKSGDVAIWHSQLVHGGSPALDPQLQRRSMVVHCCPADTHVFVDDVFLAHHSDDPPPPYYSYAESHGRLHGDFFHPDFMNSI